MMAWLPSVLSVCLLVVGAVSADLETLPPFSFIFDAGFGDNMVLQQAPSMSAVYGYLPAEYENVLVTVNG